MVEQLSPLEPVWKPGVPDPNKSSCWTTMVQGMGRYSGSSEEKQVCMP